MAAVVVQQSQERFKKLALLADEVMQCGTSLAEDVVVSCINVQGICNPCFPTLPFCIHEHWTPIIVHYCYY